MSDSIWTPADLDALRREFRDVYGGRTILVTGADGFMGSHLTDALVELGANVHAFVRATSSGALNNISHLRNRLSVHFADLTDKTSIDYLIKDLREAPDKPYVFHLGAQAHVGESWHRPYETVMANTVGTLNLLQSIVDWGLELEKFDTAGTSEEYGNVHEDVAHHHDFDDAGGLILHERSPLNPKSIYATAKVAADFLTMNYHDAFGVPGVVTRMFNNYGPRQNPRYVTGTIITQALTRPQIELGALEPLRDFCFCTDGVRGHLTVAAHGVPGDVYVYGQGKNISMGDWVELILRVGQEHGYWPDDREVVTTPARLRPGVTDVMALRVGYEKLHGETGWEPLVSWEEGVRRTIEWYAQNRDRWIGRVDWLPAAAPARSDESHARRNTSPPRRDSSSETGSSTGAGRRDGVQAAMGSGGGRAIMSRQRSRVARAGADDYETLTGKITPLWDRVPGRTLQAGTVLEIGCWLRPRSRSTSDASTTSRGPTYCAVGHLRERCCAGCSEYRARFELVPNGRLYPICVSADALPLEDNSVDLVLTSAVFLHMGKYLRGERSGGDRARSQARWCGSSSTSRFPNARNPSSYLPRLKPRPHCAARTS